MGADVLLAALREEVRVERLRFDSACASGALSSSALAQKEKKWSVTNDPSISETLHSAWRRMQKRGVDCSVAALAFEFFLQREVLELRQDEFQKGVSVQAINDSARGSEYVIDQVSVGPDNLVDAFSKCIPSIHLRRCMTSWMSQGGFALLDRAFLLEGRPVAVPGPAKQTVNYSVRRNQDSSWLFQMWCTKENFAFIVEGNGQPVMVDKESSSIVKACSVTVREVPIKPRMQEVDVDHVLSKERVGPRNPLESTDINTNQRPSFRITSGKRRTGGALTNAKAGFKLGPLDPNAPEEVTTELIVEVEDVKDIRTYTRLGENPNDESESPKIATSTHASSSTGAPRAHSSTHHHHQAHAQGSGLPIPPTVASMGESLNRALPKMAHPFNLRILSPTPRGSSDSVHTGALPTQTVYDKEPTASRQHDQHHVYSHSSSSGAAASSTRPSPAVSAAPSASPHTHHHAPVVFNPLGAGAKDAVINAAANCLGKTIPHHAPIIQHQQQQHRPKTTSSVPQRKYVPGGSHKVGGPPTFNNSFDFLD